MPTVLPPAAPGGSRWAVVALIAASLLAPAARGAEDFDPQRHLTEKRDPHRNTLLVIYDDPHTPAFPKVFMGKLPKDTAELRSHLYGRLSEAVRTLEDEEKPASLNLSVAIISSTNQWFELAAQEWRFQREDLPLALFLVGSQEAGVKYKLPLRQELEVVQSEAPDLPGQRGAFALRQFVRDALKGKGEVWLRSEPAPEAPPDAGELLQVVGKTFEDEVLRSGRDMLVMFHAPWCGFCKQLQPRLRAVARRINMDCASGRGLCMSEIDVHANDHPQSSGIGRLELIPRMFLYLGASGDHGEGLPAPLPVPHETHQKPELIYDWLLARGVVQPSRQVADDDEEF